MKELDAKWDALEKDPEFQKKPIWQQIVEIGKVVPQSEWRKQLTQILHHCQSVPKNRRGMNSTAHSSSPLKWTERLILQTFSPLQRT